MGRFSLFISSFILWLLLTWNFTWQHLSAGVIVALLATLLFGRYWKGSKFFQLNRYLWFLVYLPLFLWECIKANFDVAYRVLHPEMPIKPGIVKVKTTLKSEAAKTSLANSITMTPGTLSIEVKDEFLYIHWIYCRSTDMKKATEIIVKRFEKLLSRIFD